MSAMYTITIIVAGIDPQTSGASDLEQTLQAVEQGMAGRVRPGRRVRWEVGCPSGRTAVGSLTVNAVGSDGGREIAEHLELVRDVLTEEARDDGARA